MNTSLNNKDIIKLCKKYLKECNPKEVEREIDFIVMNKKINEAYEELRPYIENMINMDVLMSFSYDNKEYETKYYMLYYFKKVFQKK